MGAKNMFPHIQVEVMQPGGDWRIAGFMITSKIPSARGFFYLDNYDGIPLDPVNLDYKSLGRRFPGGGDLGDRTLPNVLHAQLPGVFAAKALQAIHPEYLRMPEIERLFAVGSVTKGAIRLTVKGRFPDMPVFHGWRELALAKNAAIDIYLNRLRKVHAQAIWSFSLGETGARPKASVHFPNGSEWIAKFNVPGDPYNVARMEHLMHRVAKRAGLETVQSKVEVLENDEILLMRRYDRDNGGRPIYRMPLSVLVGAENHSPQDHGTIDYLDYRRVVNRIAPEENLKLYRMMILHAAINNTDNHAGNFEILANPDGTWRLAPAFDMLPNTGYAAFATTLCLHHQRPRENGEWVRFILDSAHQFGVSPRHAAPVLRVVADIESIAREDPLRAPNERQLGEVLQAIRPSQLKEVAARIEDQARETYDLSEATFSPCP